MRQVYISGQFVPEADARVSVFDRGFLFADGVYEVTLVLGGKLIDFAGHIERLRRSLQELDMPFAMSDDELLAVHRALVEKNDLNEGLIYLQVTRGAADRDFTFPPEGTPNTVVLFTQKKSVLDSPLAARGQKVVTIDDLRWGRCDIKTVQLLFPSMAKMQAQKQGADDAWLVREGQVMEGSSNNAFIVTQDGTIITRDLSNSILHGITRKAVLECAHDLQLKVEERAFSIAEAEAAKEAFSTSASGLVNPVVKINDSTIGDGTPGPIAKRLRQIYIERSLAAAI